MDKILKESLSAVDRILKENEVPDGVDTVALDVPLLMRIMEYAREDAKTDMDLHHVAEQMIALSKTRDLLTMDDYDAIIAKTQQTADDQEPGVNESDISGIMSAARMVKDYIITAEVDGKTKKFRLRGMTGPRAAEERFSKHYSQAKVIDVKEE